MLDLSSSTNSEDNPRPSINGQALQDLPGTKMYDTEHWPSKPAEPT